ncbi:MAG: hypothetical protein QNK37_15775 [Acidobacteriota bacterium]|nr:hypothetical protein [Acidobacteriota bacterium]
MADTDVFAVWLVPNKYHGELLRRVIAELARNHDTEAFTPHVTLFTGRESSDEVLRSRLAKLAGSTGLRELKIPITGYKHSKDFFKTFFLEIDKLEALEDMAKRARAMADIPSTYKFKPHLSLIYKDLELRRRKKLENEVEDPPTEICCDRLFLVRPGNAEIGWRDIAAWRVLEMRNLS